jgi:hypothetical protein
MKGLSIAAVGAGVGSLAPTLMTGPGLRLVMPPAQAAGPVKFPLGYQIIHDLHAALEQLAVVGGLMSMAAFNEHIMLRTGIQILTEGFQAGPVSVRVTRIPVGFAITLFAMFKIGFFIAAAGYVAWIFIQSRWAPHAMEVDFEFVSEAEWWQAYPSGDMTGVYEPVPPRDLNQAYRDMTQYLYENPQLCSGFNTQPGQGGCFGAFGGGPGGPFDSPPPGWDGSPGSMEVELTPLPQ